MARGKKHLVIPDTQIKPGVPLDHIKWIANYIVDKQPDRLIIIGDWADMASLSSYDKGTKGYEGRTYDADIEVANDALADLMRPIDAEVMRRFRRRQKHWNLEKHFFMGNHENRINRTIEVDRMLEKTISTDDLHFSRYGFKVHPFLKVGVIDGVAYCHYFTSGVMGRAITTARQLLVKGHMSCIAGHQQGKDISWDKRADGTKLVGAIVGSCYLHDEAYLNPQTNQHWRGILMLHEVDNGSCDEMPVSLDFLRDKYA